MVKTLLLYDGKMSSAERIATNLSYLIGNAKVTDMADAPQNVAPYGGFCFVFNFYGAVTAGRITAFLSANQQILRNKRVALVAIGFSDSGFMNYVVNAEKNTGIKGIEGYFISNEAETVRIGTEIGRMMQIPKNPMPEEELLPRIEEFIKEHRTLALSTAEGDYIRSTPLDYSYIDGVLYVVTEGGSKFRGLMENGRAAVSLFDHHTNKTDPIRGLQISVEAKIIPVGSDEYQVIMAAKKYSADRLNDMPITLFLLKLTPLHFDFVDETLIPDGFDANQSMDTFFRKENWHAGAVYAEAAAKAAEEKAAQREEKLKRYAELNHRHEEKQEEDPRRNSDGEMTAREAHRIIQAVTAEPEEEKAQETEEEGFDDSVFDDEKPDLSDDDYADDFHQDEIDDEAKADDDSADEEDELDDDDEFDFEDETDE